jgi:hypothetical protein
VSRGQRGGSPTGFNLSFLDRLVTRGQIYANIIDPFILEMAPQCWSTIMDCVLITRIFVISETGVKLHYMGRK